MILTLRTDSSQADIALYNKFVLVDNYTWLAERRLADELLIKIQELLLKNSTSISDLTGIVVFTGTGSFTGLRIGTTIANSLAYAEGIPIVDSAGSDWVVEGIEKLSHAKNRKYVVPCYDAEPNITSAKPKT